MEILIIGGILVLVMVIVSTTIKRRAAAAYEPETVEQEDFRIEKPEGFLYPMRDKPDFPFEAYSRLFGEPRPLRNIWRARTRLRITDGLNLEEIAEGVRTGGAERFVSEKVLEDLPEGQHGIIVRSERTEDDVEYKVLRKIVEDVDRERTYELRTTLLARHEDEYTEKACRMMDSFRLR